MNNNEERLDKIEAELKKLKTWAKWADKGLFLFLGVVIISHLVDFFIRWAT